EEAPEGGAVQTPTGLGGLGEGAKDASADERRRVQAASPPPPPTASLAQYERKRDFDKTPEPGPSAEVGEGNSFVIQKHNATRLHYDLRLERDGVLVSW